MEDTIERSRERSCERVRYRQRESGEDVKKDTQEREGGDKRQKRRHHKINGRGTASTTGALRHDLALGPVAYEDDSSSIPASGPKSAASGFSGPRVQNGLLHRFLEGSGCGQKREPK